MEDSFAKMNIVSIINIFHRIKSQEKSETLFPIAPEKNNVRTGISNIISVMRICRADLGGEDFSNLDLSNTYFGSSRLNSYLTQVTVQDERLASSFSLAAKFDGAKLSFENLVGRIETSRVIEMFVFRERLFLIHENGLIEVFSTVIYEIVDNLWVIEKNKSKILCVHEYINQGVLFLLPDRNDLIIRFDLDTFEKKIIQLPFQIRDFSISWFRNIEKFFLILPNNNIKMLCYKDQDYSQHSYLEDIPFAYSQQQQFSFEVNTQGSIAIDAKSNSFATSNGIYKIVDCYEEIENRLSYAGCRSIKIRSLPKWPDQYTIYPEILISVDQEYYLLSRILRPDGQFLEDKLLYWLPAVGSDYQVVGITSAEGYILKVNDEKRIALSMENSMRNWNGSKTYKLVLLDKANLLRTEHKMTNFLEHKILNFAWLDSSSLLLLLSNRLEIVNMSRQVRIIHSIQSNEVSCAAFCQVQGLFAVAMKFDPVVRLFSVKNGYLVSSLSCNSDGIRAIAFSPSGKYIVVAYADGKLLEWNIENIFFPRHRTIRNTSIKLISANNLSYDSTEDCIAGIVGCPAGQKDLKEWYKISIDRNRRICSFTSLGSLKDFSVVRYNRTGKFLQRCRRAQEGSTEAINTCDISDDGSCILYGNYLKRNKTGEQNVEIHNDKYIIKKFMPHTHRLLLVKRNGYEIEVLDEQNGIDQHLNFDNIEICFIDATDDGQVILVIDKSGYVIILEKNENYYLQKLSFRLYSNVNVAGVNLCNLRDSSFSESEKNVLRTYGAIC